MKVNLKKYRKKSLEMSILRRLKKCMECKTNDKDNIEICSNDMSNPHFICKPCLENLKDKARADIIEWDIECKECKSRSSEDKPIILMKELYEGYTGVVEKIEKKIKRKEVEYKDGCIVSEKRWGEDGCFEYHSIYDEGQKVGNHNLFLSMTYHKNGKLKSRGRHNKKTGFLSHSNRGKYEEWYENESIKSLYFFNDIGLLEGAFEEWYENGIKKKEYHYKNGREEGQQIDYHENGNKYSEYTINNGKMEGEWKRWYENGKIREIERYQDKKMGLTERYYKNGKIQERIQYKYGKKDGLEEEWTNKGIKIKSIMWKEDKEEGEKKEWYVSGQKKLECTYKDGKKNGLYIEWYEKKDYKKTDKEEDLQIKSQFNYKDDYSIGECINYYENGNIQFRRYEKIIDNQVWDGNIYEDTMIIIKEEYTKKGILEKKDEEKRNKDNKIERETKTTYYEDGSIKEKREKWSFNKEEYYTKYHKNGRIEKTNDPLLKNILEKEKEKEEEGEIIYMEGEDGKSHHEEYHPNGKKKKEVRWFKSTGLNRYLEYYMNGKIKNQYDEDDRGKRQGVSLYYFRTGQLEKEINFRDDKKNGVRREYYLNGQMREEENYINDNLDGERKMWTVDGELRFMEKYKDGKKIEVTYYDCYHE